MLGTFGLSRLRCLRHNFLGKWLRGSLLNWALYAKVSMKYLFITLLSLTLIACVDDGYLRGHVEPSQDGETYFGVIDNNGGKCGPILVDGKAWEVPLGEVAQIESGEHIIHCGISISFVIPNGVVFKFDYWGP